MDKQEQGNKISKKDMVEEKRIKENNIIKQEEEKPED